MTAFTIPWIRWNESDYGRQRSERIYIGSETCENQLPGIEVMLNTITKLVEEQIEITLVTPVVTESGLMKLCDLFERFLRQQISIEVVFNDYGVLQILNEYQNLEPVAGRLLSGQCCDPRLALMLDSSWQRIFERELNHMDGSRVYLRYQEPDELLERHLKSPAVVNLDWLNYLSEFGVRRFEVSNLTQGLELRIPDGWRVSLHAPKVNIALRRCSRLNDGACDADGCPPAMRLVLPEFEVPVYLSNCEVYYQNQSLPDFEYLKCIDRIIRSEVMD